MKIVVDNDENKQKADDFKEYDLMHSTTNAIVGVINSATEHGLSSELIVRSLSSIYAYVVDKNAADKLKQLDVITEDIMDDIWFHTVWSSVALVHEDLQLYKDNYKL
jgi:hypothetical protein